MRAGWRAEVRPFPDAHRRATNPYYRYRLGCRCAECRAANRAKTRRYRASPIVEASWVIVGFPVDIVTRAVVDDAEIARRYPSLDSLPRASRSEMASDLDP